MSISLSLFLVKYILFPVIIGVVSTATYVLLFDKLLRNILLPWYFSQKYKSTLIEGKWVGRTGGESYYDFEMFLTQTGDRVRGEIFVKTFYATPKQEKEQPVEVDSNIYTFEGEIKDGFVRIVHKERDRNSFGFGCFLLQIAGGGKTLNGSVVYVAEDPDGYRVSTTDNIHLTRVIRGK